MIDLSVPAGIRKFLSGARYLLLLLPVYCLFGSVQAGCGSDSESARSSKNAITGDEAGRDGSGSGYGYGDYGDYGDYGYDGYYGYGDGKP